MEPQVFDASRPLALNLRTPGGLKTVRVRFPSDEEWTTRQRRRKVIMKSLGRGINETVVPAGEDIDAALLAKIRTEETPEVDPFEAKKLMEQLGTADVDDVQATGDGYAVTLRVLGATTVHTLKTPSAREAFDFERGYAKVLDLPYNRQEYTINLAPAAELYKKLLVQAEGYVGDVPIIHQAVVVKAAIDALNGAFAQDQDASF